MLHGHVKNREQFQRHWDENCASLCDVVPSHLLADTSMSSVVPSRTSWPDALESSLR